jgi:flagellin-like hook-associated protein FlgL
MPGIDILSLVQTDTEALRLRLQTLTRQVATGKIGAVAGDIAPQLARAQSLGSAMSRLDTYGKVIDRTLGETQASQTALKQLQDIATQFANTTAIKLDPSDTQSLAFAASAAKRALVQAGQLLNSQYQGQYLFGGTDSANPPVPNAEGLPTSGLATQIAAAVATLGGGNTTSIDASTKAIAQSDTAGVTPFSAFVSDPATGLAEGRRSIPTADGQTLPFGLFANRNADTASNGNTTGSWARDLLRGLASIAALTPAQAAVPQDFRQLTSLIRDGLHAASDGISNEAGALGLTEQQLKTTQDNHAAMRDALKGQLAGITDVDMASTLAALQQTQTALQASYTVLGRLANLNLTQFLR